MCDYSLCGLPNRLASDGEELVVHRFRTGSMGLVSPEELVELPPPQPRKGFWALVKTFLVEPPRSPVRMVVCLPPGAQLILKQIPADLQRRWDLEPEEYAMFVQTSADVNRYRDALQFRVGPPVLLQEMREGMRVQVLSLESVSVDNDRISAIAAL